MGLFDTVYFKDLKIKRNLLPKNLGELSLKEIQEADYQTKDLGETYNGYFYFKKNKKSFDFYKHDIEYKWVEGNKNGKSVMDRLGHLEEIDSKEILINDLGTNTIRVYEFFTKENHDYWVEFSLVFIENKFHKIELHEFREEKNNERKLKSEELVQMMKKQSEFNKSIKGKIYNFIRNFYQKTIFKVQFFIGNCFIKIGNFLRYSKLF